jgi:hypothetical protein
VKISAAVALYDQIGIDYDATRAADPYFAEPPAAPPVSRAGRALPRDPEPIERGLARLKSDIASGRIADVMRRYAHDGGGCMFTVGVK